MTSIFVIIVILQVINGIAYAIYAEDQRGDKFFIALAVITTGELIIAGMWHLAIMYLD